MKRRYILGTILIAIGVLVLTVPGCDELTTEIIEVTIAGHPTAEFGIDGADSGCVPLMVQFQDYSDGPRTDYLWYFGDGDSSLDTNPVHTYDSAGTYAVSLRIYHGPTEGEDTETKNRFVVVGHSIDSFELSADSGCPGLEVTFNGINAFGIDSWSWNFGDGGTDTAASPTHIYNSVSQYTVQLTVNGDCGQTILTQTDVIRITECPTAIIDSDTTFGCLEAPGFVVQFYDSSDPGSQAITGRSWDFGNDETSTEQNPVVTYTEAGSYTVTLTSTSTGGSNTVVEEDYITVVDNTEAAFSLLSPDTGCISDFQDFRVSFQDESSGEPTLHTWDFGDGFQSNNSDPVHAYTTPGRYTVTLSVEGPCGPDDTTMTDLIVLADTLDNASFTIEPASRTGTVDTVFTFTDTSPGLITGRSWTFSDGLNSRNDSTFTLSFTTVDTIVVTLEISNPCGVDTAIDSVFILESIP